jgi:general secretion pathway protein E
MACVKWIFAFHLTQRSLEELGFSDEQVQTLIQQIKQPQGLFIITGPTGSGKTTTLYSILQYLNSSERNIMTLEQPVEYRLPMIRQSEIKEMTKTSFADGVRSLLRQDPDIIFIGEVRDEDTAQMALRAAMTGHLVFTTLHTNDSISVISRLRDLGLKPSIVADYLVAAVSQRLLRLVCAACKGDGCETCHHTGYKGRQAVGEILVFNSALKESVADEMSLAGLRKKIKEQGFKPMKSVANDLIQKGLTTQEEAEFHLGFDNDSGQ